MMRKLSWMLLALLVLAGCGEEITTEEEKPKFQDVEEARWRRCGPEGTDNLEQRWSRDGFGPGGFIWDGWCYEWAWRLDGKIKAVA